MFEEGRRAALNKAFVGMARGLGPSVVAGGVETTTQSAFQHERNQLGGGRMQEEDAFV